MQLFARCFSFVTFSNDSLAVLCYKDVIRLNRVHSELYVLLRMGRCDSLLCSSSERRCLMCNTDMYEYFKFDIRFNKP
jgi:hypothetical protein